MSVVYNNSSKLGDTLQFGVRIGQGRSNSGFDEYGNPIGAVYDLGGMDDERLQGERILLYKPTWQELGAPYRWTLVERAVRERKLAVDFLEITTYASECPITKAQLAGYSQVWLVSFPQVTLNWAQVDLICEFSRSGGGVFLLADNEPLFGDANLIAERLIGTRFSGNKLAEGILRPGRQLQPSVFLEHPLTQGLNQLYEGTSICTIAPAPNLTILAQSHDGQYCMACYEKGNQRLVLDTGFTKFHDGWFMKSAGTPRYLRNIAFWLARGSRGVEYTSFTPGKESIATIGQGETSQRYRFTLNEPATLTYLLHWEGSGTLRLTVQNPQGKTVYDAPANKPPVRAQIPASEKGDWTCWVRGEQVSQPKIPYVLTLAREPYKAGSAPVVVKPRPVRHPERGYTKAWNSAQPGLLIILVDLSSSMADPFGGTQLGKGKRKADMVATVLNSILNEFVKTNTVGTVVKPRADIAVLGYEGATCRSLLGKGLSGKPYVSLAELNENPLRIEQRTSAEIMDNGSVVQRPVLFPVWVDVQVGTATPMCAALAKAKDLAQTWVKTHSDNHPPVVINITDGVSTDGDPTEAADDLCNVRTNDGETLLFNCYLTTTAAATVEYPNNEGQVPADSEGIGKLLFAVSSVIPDVSRQNLAAAQMQVTPGARGLILNGDANSVRNLIVFASTAASFNRNR